MLLVLIAFSPPSLLLVLVLVLVVVLLHGWCQRVERERRSCGWGVCDDAAP